MVAQVMETLQNPHAMLVGLREELAGAYQEMLHQAKLEKGSNARNRVRKGIGCSGVAGRGSFPLLMGRWVLPAGGGPLARDHVVHFG